MLNYAASFLYTVEAKNTDLEKDKQEVFEDALVEEEFKTEDYDLNEKWIKRAFSEINEDSLNVKENIEELKSFMEEGDDLLVPKNDIFLLKVLRAKSHNLEAAKAMLKRCSDTKRDYREYFEASLPSLAKSTFEHGIQTVLKHRDLKARRVFVFKVSNWDPSLVTKQEMFSANYLCLELMAQEQKTQVSGISAIVDVSGLSWSHWMQMTLDFIYAMVAMVQNSFPLRFKEIHIVNENPYFTMAYNLVSPYLTDKMRKRIQFHGDNFSGLHSSVPPEILPPLYGGSLKQEEDERLQNSHVVEALLQREQLYSQLHQLLDY